MATGNEDTSLADNEQRHNPGSKDALRIYEGLHQLIRDDLLVKGIDRKSKVTDFVQPEELKEIFEKIGPKKNGAGVEEILDACEKMIKYSVKTGHPYFFNQLYSGVNPYSLAGAWLTEALNTNAHTFEVAPVFNLMELKMIEKLNQYVGFPDGDGAFVPGGNLGTMTCLHLARYRLDKDIKEEGFYGRKPLIIFQSDMAHYATPQAASFLGFGQKHVVSVKTDARGRMIPEELELKIKEARDTGGEPLAVVATVCTTVLGAFDPLDDIADICERHGLWLHADGAIGAGVLVSDKWKHLLKGIHRADSVLWNLHKLLGAQLQASAVLIKQKGLLEECNGTQAAYLYQPDKNYDISYDIGDKTVQCGRKTDALKLWLMWKGLGDSGLAQVVDKAFDNARYLTKTLVASEGFRLVLPEFEANNVCFWYIPPRMRGLDETGDWWKDLHEVAPKIKERMMTSGRMMIGYQPMTSKGYVNFFRIVLKNPLLNHKDMHHVLETIHQLGMDL